MATEIWVNTGSGDCLFPDGTPMLTDHQWGPVTFILWRFHKRCLKHQSLKSVWKLHTCNVIQISLVNCFKAIPMFACISHHSSISGCNKDITTLVHIIARGQPSEKSLSETMMVNLLTHKYVTRLQWVNSKTELNSRWKVSPWHLSGGSINCSANDHSTQVPIVIMAYQVSYVTALWDIRFNTRKCARYFEILWHILNDVIIMSTNVLRHQRKS